MASDHVVAAPANGARIGPKGSDVRCWPFYGWVVVILCILCKVWKCQGQNNIMTYTVPYLLAEFKLSHSELGSLFSLATICASFIQPGLGRLMDRFGGRICIPATQIAFGATLLAFSVWQPARERLFLYAEVVSLFFFLRAIALGAAETFPNACIQQWFHRRRGRALAITAMCQQIGNGLAAPLVSGLVVGAGWRFAMQVGASVNLILAPFSLLLLRRCPEDCGLLPDGDRRTGPIKSDNDQGPMSDKSLPVPGTQRQSDQSPPHGGLWQILMFTFFYAVIFGGNDFFMVEMVAEAAGPRSGDIKVAYHLYAPMAVSLAVLVPVVGEVMDRFSQQKKWIPLFLLTCCGILTAVATLILCIIFSPILAVVYGVMRGLTSSIFTCLLTSGLAFSAMGVEREHIGSILGLNQLATLAGTGCGPLIYGVSCDVFGRYRGALIATSLPPFVLGLIFLRESLRNAGVDRSHASLERHATCSGELEPLPIGSSKLAGADDSGLVEEIVGEETETEAAMELLAQQEPDPEASPVGLSPV